MDRATYIHQRREINASSRPGADDVVTTYEMVFVDKAYDPPDPKYGARQRRWKIFSLGTEDNPVVPDVEKDDPVAYCDVPDVEGFITMVPPTSGWKPDIKMCVAKGCYVVMNEPGWAPVAYPQPFYLPFGIRNDTLYPESENPQAIVSTYFQQAMYNDGVDDPSLFTPHYLFFKVTPELPGGFWVLSDSLGGEAFYSSTTSTFPPVFNGGTKPAPYPEFKANENWVAGAYAPPRQLVYNEKVVGEVITKIEHAIIEKGVQGIEFRKDNIDATAHTVTFADDHGLGTVGWPINLKFELITGTAPTGLVHNTAYDFFVVSKKVLLLNAIESVGSPDFTGNLIKTKGDSVLATAQIPKLIVAPEEKDWVLSRVWEFFPKHYEMHHYPYAEYWANASLGEHTTRSASASSYGTSGYIGARCNRIKDPEAPFLETYEGPVTITQTMSNESMTADYTHLLTPYLKESANFDRVDWVQHVGQEGGEPTGSYSYNMSSVTTRAGAAESSSSTTKTGTSITRRPGHSYIRIQPFTFQPDESSEYPKPYNGIGTYAELDVGASGTLGINTESDSTGRAKHEHIQICPDNDYEIYDYKFNVGVVFLGAKDAWETCHSALLKVDALAVTVWTEQHFYGRAWEFKRLMYQLGRDPLTGDLPCIDPNATDCCNYRLTGSDQTGYKFDLAIKPLLTPQPNGITAYKYELMVITKTNIGNKPIDHAHDGAPLVSVSTAITESMGVGSGHAVKGFNYMAPIDPHDMLLRCPLSIASETTSTSSSAFLSHSYKALGIGTAAIYTESQSMSISYSQSKTKGLMDSGLVERTLNYSKSEVRNIVKTDITFDPFTAAVTGSTTTVDRHAKLTTTDTAEHPEYDEIVRVTSGTPGEIAVVTASVDKPVGALLTKWSETDGSSSTSYYNTKNTDLT